MVGMNQLVLCQEEMCRAMDIYLRKILTCVDGLPARCVSVTPKVEGHDTVFVLHLDDGNADPKS